MVTFAALILTGGVFLLVAAAVMGLLTVRSRRAYQVIAGTTLGPLDARRGGVIAASAVTEFGPGGPQVGPISGEECTWWQIQVVRSPSRGSEDRTGTDDLGTFFAPGGPALSDGSATVAVDPQVLVRALTSGRSAGTERSGTMVGPRFGTPVPSFVPRGMVGKVRSHEDIQLIEIRLPRGREVFTVGTLRGGTLTPVRGGTVFTTDARDTVLAGLGRDSSGTGAMTRAFGLLGLIATVASSGLLYVLLR